MALKVTLTTLVLVAWMTIQMVIEPSHADGMDDWDDTVNSIVNGIEWIAEGMGKAKGIDASLKEEKEGKQMKLEEFAEKSDRDPRQLWTEEAQVQNAEEEEEEEYAKGKVVAESEEQGRLFFGTGTNGTTVTLDLQAIQTAIGAVLFIGISIIVILLIISLVTGRDILSITNGFANKFTSPLSDPWYTPNNNNYYRDESTYTSYRAFEDAAKKYEQDQDQDQHQ